ncbi:glucose-6-phosphate dehydrogenase assembly protein OpcA [Skermania piniformis]|uniref:Glucose-6-phosphate dehydrogenase assembly protein OpcA n=1 Tax=Skermania pinensis TaxID=39122 RepID=A0ABX8S5X0_9ACTN|nr:glucose-6-phosphate dehydrogenase assembly protein OpcA [Skermania piniformis]QXQ12407.1 glucose-6-phosphate dehydrogenase assembly protein OpcA [Skermania piniformis]
MIVDLPDTDTGAVNKKLLALREEDGVVTLGRVLTLVICIRADDAEEAAAIDAAAAAGREHPCRVIVLARGRSDAATGMDAQIRLGDGASEVVVLRLRGELRDHQDSVVMPFLLPDTPVVAWWPDHAPSAPAESAVGRLAVRRITDATNARDPLAAIRSRRAVYSAGDTDLAWARITRWRALLTATLDEPPYEPVTSVTVSGLRDEPALDLLAGWLADRLRCPVRRVVGDLRVDLIRPSETVSVSRPQDGPTATLSRSGRPDRLVALARRETRECLAEDLRRLDADEIYAGALDGLERVSHD